MRASATGSVCRQPAGVPPASFGWESEDAPGAGRDQFHPHHKDEREQNSRCRFHNGLMTEFLVGVFSACAENAGVEFSKNPGGLAPEKNVVFAGAPDYAAIIANPHDP